MLTAQQHAAMQHLESFQLLGYAGWEALKVDSRTLLSLEKRGLILGDYFRGARRPEDGRSVLSPSYLHYLTERGYQTLIEYRASLKKRGVGG